MTDNEKKAQARQLREELARKERERREAYKAKRRSRYRRLREAGYDAAFSNRAAGLPDKTVDDLIKLRRAEQEGKAPSE
jgi:hypothetical protein